MAKFTITPDDMRRAKMVKPGWYPTLISDVNEEMNAKKDATNIVLDCENADVDSGFVGVPVKHWLSEKGVAFPGGAVALAKAFNPKMDESKVQDIDYSDYKGRYIYAKWVQSRGGKDEGAPLRNAIEDWAPLPKKFETLVNAVKTIDDSVGGFDA